MKKSKKNKNLMGVSVVNEVNEGQIKGKRGKGKP